MVQQDSSDVKRSEILGDVHALLSKKKRRRVESLSETARTLFCSYNCLHIILVSFSLLVIYIRTRRG